MRPSVILLVEDNPDDIALTQRAFKKCTFANELIVAHDGAEALEMLFGPPGATATISSLPAVVLLDLNLPKVSGLEVLKQIRNQERTRCLPIVVLTSSLEEKDLVESYNLGTNSYVRKPICFEEFVEATQQLGMYWLLLNQPPPQLNFE